MSQALLERATIFTTRIYKVCKVLDTMKGSERVIARQLMRSGSSIGANIAEGDGSQTKPDFLTKYSIALKEARETHYWLDVIGRTGILPENKVCDLKSECSELVAILTSICKTTKQKLNKSSIT